MADSFILISQISFFPDSGFMFTLFINISKSKPHDVKRNSFSSAQVEVVKVEFRVVYESEVSSRMNFMSLLCKVAFLSLWAASVWAEHHLCLAPWASSGSVFVMQNSPASLGRTELDSKHVWCQRRTANHNVFQQLTPPIYNPETIIPPHAPSCHMKHDEEMKSWTISMSGSSGEDGIRKPLGRCSGVQTAGEAAGRTSGFISDVAEKISIWSLSNHEEFWFTQLHS